MEANKLQRLLQLQLSPDPLIRPSSEQKETSSTAFKDLLNDMLTGGVQQQDQQYEALTTAINRGNDLLDSLHAAPPPGLGQSSTPADHSIAGSTNQSALYAPLISQAAERHGVPRALIEALIQAESTFRADAVSSAGAKGLMQLMDKTAEWLGVKDSFDPAQNIEGGTRYLGQLLERYQGSIPVALAAYNSGPGTLSRLGIANEQDLAQRYNLLPAETRNYIPKVEQYLAAFSTN